MSPWVDFEGRGESLEKNATIDPILQPWMVQQFAAWYLNGQSPTRVASTYADDLSDLPPILIHAGTREILLDDAKLLANCLRDTNVDMELKIWPEKSTKRYIRLE